MVPCLDIFGGFEIPGFPWVLKKTTNVKLFIKLGVVHSLLLVKVLFQLRHLEKTNPAGSPQCFNASILKVSCRRFT